MGGPILSLLCFFMSRIFNHCPFAFAYGQKGICMNVLLFFSLKRFSRAFFLKGQLYHVISSYCILELNFICSWNSYSVRDLSCPGPPSLCAKTSSRAVHRCSPRLSPILAASTSHRKKTHTIQGQTWVWLCCIFGYSLRFTYSVSIWLFWLAQFRHDTWNPYIQKQNSSALRIPEKRRSPWWKTTSALVAIDISSLWLGGAVTRPWLEPPHIGIYWDNSARVMKHIQCFMW